MRLVINAIAIALMVQMIQMAQASQSHSIAECSKKIDWHSIASQKDIDVVFTLMSAEFSNIDELSAWLLGQGFTQVDILPEPLSVMLHLGENAPGHLISAVWVKSKKPFPFRSFPFGPVAALGARAFTLSFTANHSGSIIRLRSSFTYK